MIVRASSILLIAMMALTAATSAHAQAACTGSHCDVLVARLMITGEDCATQTFDASQTLEYSQLAVGARDFDTFPVANRFPVYAFDQRLDGSYSTDDPGFSTVPSPCSEQPLLSPLPGNRDLNVDFLTEVPTGGGPARNVLYWDAIDDDLNGLDVNDVEWTPVPLDEIIRFDELGTQAIADGGTSEIPGLVIDDTNGNGSLHDHVDFELRRAGGGLPSLGVYLMKVDLTMSGFAEGSPIHLVWGTVSIPVGAEDVARQYVDEQMVFSLCDDGIDNDRDGLIDYAGGDPGCDSPEDDSEKSTTYECDDGIDNDGDGLIDYRGDTFGSAGLYAERDPECDAQGAMGVSEAPEPGATALFVSGLGVLVALRRRRAQKSRA